MHSDILTATISSFATKPGLFMGKRTGYFLIRSVNPAALHIKIFAAVGYMDNIDFPMVSSIARP